jgi:hypothetical protein
MWSNRTSAVPEVGGPWGARRDHLGATLTSSAQVERPDGRSVGWRRAGADAPVR